jgi:hypothetical protein
VSDGFLGVDLYPPCAVFCLVSNGGTAADIAGEGPCRRRTMRIG